MIGVTRPRFSGGSGASRGGRGGGRSVSAGGGLRKESSGASRSGSGGGGSSRAGAPGRAVVRRAQGSGGRSAQEQWGLSEEDAAAIASSSGGSSKSQVASSRAALARLVRRQPQEAPAAVRARAPAASPQVGVWRRAQVGGRRSSQVGGARKSAAAARVQSTGSAGGSRKASGGARARPRGAAADDWFPARRKQPFWQLQEALISYRTRRSRTRGSVCIAYSRDSTRYGFKTTASPRRRSRARRASRRPHPAAGPPRSRLHVTSGVNRSRMNLRRASRRPDPLPASSSGADACVKRDAANTRGVSVWDRLDIHAAGNRGRRLAAKRLSHTPSPLTAYTGPHLRLDFEDPRARIGKGRADLCVIVGVVGKAVLAAQIPPRGAVRGGLTPGTCNELRPPPRTVGRKNLR